MSGGTVTVANDATVGLSSGGSDFAAVGGLIQVAGALRLGAPTGGGSGRVLLTGASLVSDRIDVANGSYMQFSGLTSVGQMRIPSAPSGLADGTLSGGMLRSGQVDVGLDLSGSFYQDGGTHINTNGIFMWGRTHGGANTELGNYTLGGGQIQAQTIGVNGGRFNLFGGTNTTFQFSVEASGNCVINGSLL